MLVEQVLKASPIYTEYNADSDGYHEQMKKKHISKGSRKADVYFEIKKAFGRYDKYAIEIQKDMGNKYREKTENFYLDMDITPIIIPLKEIPDDINEIWKVIKEKL